MTRLFIENHELDLTADITAQLNYAVDDLINLDSKSASYSKTIVIPGTVRNNAIFGNIFEFTNSNFPIDGNPNVYYNFNASKSAQAMIEIGGLPSMKGVLRLMGIIIDNGTIEYEIVLFSELAGFINNLGNKKLEDLDFSEYDQDWNKANITKSWDYYEDGKGVVFPLIDYGNVSTNKHDYKFNAFRPALFVKEYLEKIISDAGYTHTAYFLEDSFFKRLIVPNNDKELLNKDFNYYADVDHPSWNYDSTYQYPKATALIGYNEFNTLSDFSTSGTYDQILTYTGTQTRNVSIAFNLNGGYEHQYKVHTGKLAVLRNLYSYIACFKNGIEIAKFDLPVTPRPGNVGSGPFTYNGNINAVINLTTEISTNDTIEFKGITYDDLSYWDTRIEFIDATVTLKISNNPPGFITYVYNDNLKINYTIPKNIFQRDFFTSIMKMFNLMVIESPTKNKHIHIIPNIDFYDLNNILDWSDKVNRNKPIKIKPMSEINARYYNFNYKSDSDYYNELYKKRWNQTYGDRQYDNQMEFATQEKKMEVIFSPSVLVGYPGEDKVVTTICKIDNKGTANETEESIAHNIRIMQCKKVTGVSSYEFQNADGDNLGDLTTYLYAGHFNDPDNVTSDINFGATKELFYNLTTGSLQNNLFNAFYSSYMAEITDKDSRLVSCEMYLDNVDIFNLDFRKLIFFDGCLYRLAKISDWSEGELCKVDLLRVINTAYDANTVHYGYVQICNQIWSKNNLNVDKFRNGDSITEITDNTGWEEATVAARCYYNNDSSYASQYGQLYNWYAIKDIRNIAPNGWRIPTNADFNELMDCVGSNKSYRLKSLSWVGSVTTPTNDYSFSAVQSGYRDADDASIFGNTQCVLWSLTEFDSNKAYSFWIKNADAFLLDAYKKWFGFSVRLIIE